MKVKMKITNPYGPNTTLMLPGSCNAACDFCFWNRDEAKIKPPADYLDRVFSHLAKLPDAFQVLSISGGEPTLSPWFGRVLARLGQHRRSHHLDRVVLTTHGGNLLPFVTAVGCVVDHVNISRHAIGTAANRDVFKTDKVPTDDALRDMVLRLHSETACDVTLNCVVRPDISVDFCDEFIAYAKDLGADAVSFRKVASDAAPTATEAIFAAKYGVLNETKCPVCRGMEQQVNGFAVRWKGSVSEPSLQTGGIYEVVIHPDGNVYADWGMKIPLVFAPQPPRQPPMPVQAIAPSYGGGCGSRSGCGSSGC